MDAAIRHLDVTVSSKSRYGFGFNNPKALVMRALWITRATGRIPTREEVENMDALWEQDVLEANHQYEWRKWSLKKKET